jgi:hypothetical protein
MMVNNIVYLREMIAADFSSPEEMEIYMSRASGVESVGFTLTEISSVRKQATNAARVNFTMRVDVETGDDNWAQFFDGFSTSSPGWGDGEIQMEVLLFRTGGEWKIAEITRRNNFRGGHVTYSHSEIIR